MKFDVWEEGYVITGNSANASFNCTVEGDSFKEACMERYREDETYDPERNTRWGCRLFDNEVDARKSFG